MSRAGVGPEWTWLRPPPTAATGATSTLTWDLALKRAPSVPISFWITRAHNLAKGAARQVFALCRCFDSAGEM
jgi:hypothetical protein